MPKSLTEAMIRTLKPGTKADGSPKRIVVKADRNLFIQCDAGVEGPVRSWLFRYCFGNRTRQLGLGPWPTLSLAEARDKAAVQRGILASGRDPLIEKRAAKAAVLAAIEADKAPKKVTMSFRQAAGEYIDSHKAGWKSEKSLAAWTGTLRTYAFPVIGALDVADVTEDHVLKIVSPIWTTKNVSARNILNRIGKILSFAMARGYRARGLNPAAWKDGLQHSLPPSAKFAQVRHHPALPYTEIASFMAELREIDDLAARCLELLVLTAVRSSEARLARWNEVDLERRTWVIPSARMKMGRQHTVPLSDAAVEILVRLRAGQDVEPSGFIFARPHGLPFSEAGMREILQRLRPGISVHGCRSSFRDWAADVVGAPRELAEEALAHLVGNAVERSYRRGDALERRRVLMAQWAEYATRNADIIPLVRQSA
jgi:integrase